MDDDPMAKGIERKRQVHGLKSFAIAESGNRENVLEFLYRLSSFRCRKD